MSKEAMKLALEALTATMSTHGFREHIEEAQDKAIEALEEALAKQEQGEPVTLLPDGSAFGVMSFPLPDDHWIYAPNEYRDGEYEPIDLPKPILTHALRDEVVAAVRYAVRGATMRGQEQDFDPDALVQNAVYALCGPYTTPQQPSTIVRTWVSLTADEVTIIEHEVYGRTVQKGKPMSVFITQFAKAIDSALKGKNHHA